MMGVPGETEKIPKRWWWTKRLVAVLAVCAVVTAGARLWWGCHAENQLRIELDAINARGEVIEWVNLAPPPIPDERNAAELYKKAFDSPLLGEYGRGPFKRDSEEFRLDRLAGLVSDLIAHADFRREHGKDAQEILKLSGNLLALCRQARGMEGADWKLDYSGPAIDFSLAPLGKCKQSAMILCLAAMEAHDAGDDAEAVEYIRDALSLSDALEGVPTLVPHLMSLGIHGLGCLTIERITPSLRVGEGGQAVAARQVRSLIADLLDEQAARHGLFMAFIGERARYYDIIRRFKQWQRDETTPLWQDPGELMVRYASGPAWTLSAARTIRYNSAYVSAARQNSYPAAKANFLAAKAKLPVMKDDFDDNVLWTATHILEYMTMPSLGGSFRSYFTATSQRRMSAVALAMRLYELDHGRRPDTLDELLGKYIPAIPKDPFTTDGQPLRYRPRAEKPVLYSVGVDGKDNGGLYRSAGKGRVGTDLLFFLDGNRPVDNKPDWREPTALGERKTFHRSGGPRSKTGRSAATSRPRPAAR